MLLTTGWNGYYKLAGTEAVVVLREPASLPNGQQLTGWCRLQSHQMPTTNPPLYHATGGVLRVRSDNSSAITGIPIVCGGSNGNDKCYHLEKMLPSCPQSLGR